jgi:hypothetical protein
VTNHVERWIAGGLALVLVVFLGVAMFLIGKGEGPARINVRCIGDHLLFESERTGDIQVIPNKCKKSYPKKQAPVTEA